MAWRVVAVSLGCLIALVSEPGAEPRGETVPVEFRADRMQAWPGDSILVLSGRVNVISGDMSLSADRITLDKENGRASARGNVVLWDHGEKLFGEEAICDFQSREAVILDAKYDGLSIFAEADRIVLRQTEEDREYVLHNSRITTCDLPIPHYHLAPRTITIEPERRVVIRDTALYIDDIPVFYLPFFRRSLRKSRYGYVLTPGYSSRKGAIVYNKFTYRYNEWIRPRLYADWFSKVGIGAGAANRFGGARGSDFYGRVYAYGIDMKSDNPYLDEEDNIGKDIDNERWRIAGEFYKEVYRDLVFSSRFQKLSDEDFNRDFEDVGYQHHFSTQDLESDRNSFANLAKRWDSINMRVLYKERLHDLYLTSLPDDERKPQLTIDMMENRILESPLFWDALVQYDHDLAVERAQRFDDPLIGIDPRDEFLTRSNTDRLHGEALLSLPFSLSFLRVIPRAGVLANSYENTSRFVEYTDNFGTDDSLYREEFAPVDQVAGQAGVELNTRAVADFSGPVGEYEEMRLVVEPNVTFDVFDAKEDLTQKSPSNIDLQGPLAGSLPGIVSLPAGHPVYDDRDAPLRDARVLGGRLDTKLQGRRSSGGTQNILVHSISTAYDFDSELYADLHSDVFVWPIPQLRISNFVEYDLNDEFTRLASVGGTLSAASRLTVSGHYTTFKETEDALREEFLITGLDFGVGDKYTLGFSGRIDLDEGDLVRTTAKIGRDMHDAVTNLLFRYRDGKNGEDDEFEVRLVLNVPFDRPGSLMGDVF